MSVLNTSRQLIQIEAQREGWVVCFPPEDHETDYYVKGNRRIRVVSPTGSAGGCPPLLPWGRSSAPRCATA